jgi:hypothetical protein
MCDTLPGILYTFSFIFRSMSSSRVNLKLSSEDGEETLAALKRYQDGYQLNSIEDTIQHLLPDWAFDTRVRHPKIAAVIEESQVQTENRELAEEVYSPARSQTDDTDEWTVQRFALSVMYRVEDFVSETDADLDGLSVYHVEEEYVEEGFGQDDGESVREWFNSVSEYLCDVPTQHPELTVELVDILSEETPKRRLLFVPMGEPAAAYTRSYTPSHMVSDPTSTEITQSSH